METGSATRRDDAGGPPLALLLALTLAVRCLEPRQPLVENYVGRQVPTAMVARNLERGSGFLDPRLDVAPFPNRFLVEPPLYEAAVVGLREITGMPLGAAGRIVSALGFAAAVWGTYRLVAARSGRAAALLAAGALAAFPVGVRYGRSFQPDALMLGTLTAGLACWDRHERLGGRSWLAAGVALVATGLALKVLAAFLLVPLVLVIARGGRLRASALAAATLVPAVLWYAHAASVLAGAGGSKASSDNGAIWLHALDPTALLRRETLANVGWLFGVRGFTPLGPPLALAGLLWGGPEPDERRLWRVWGVAGLLTLAAVASKLHHEYYGLLVAPVVAAGVGLALRDLTPRGAVGRWGAIGAGTGLLLMGFVLSRSTWRTPPEWASLGRAAAALQQSTRPTDWVAAPEALLFAADRRGCRIEYTEASARRAAREWAGTAGGDAAATVDGPTALVAFYREQGARYFADVVPAEPGASRLALHDAVRRRYNVLMDRDGVILADLDGPPEEDGPPHHATRPR